MANPRLIKKRVGSIANIKKITKALEMVAASKVQRAQDAALAAKPYADKIFELIRSLRSEALHSEIPLLRMPENITSDFYVIISTNRGLAGSLNTNLFRKTSDFLQTQKGLTHAFATVGKKGRSFAVAYGTLLADFSDYIPLSSAAPHIVRLIIDTFTQGKANAVYVVYNDFVSSLVQKPKIKRLLPLNVKEMFGKEQKEPFDILDESEESVVNENQVKYSFEPSRETVLKELLPFYLEIQVSAALIEAEASEHSARMIAMKNASDNATELGDALALEYNKERQAVITNEISDITTASNTLVGGN